MVHMHEVEVDVGTAVVVVMVVVVVVMVEVVVAAEIVMNGSLSFKSASPQRKVSGSLTNNNVAL